MDNMVICDQSDPGHVCKGANLTDIPSSDPPSPSTKPGHVSASIDRQHPA